MRTLLVVGSFALQPLLWLAILRSWLTSRSRVAHERHDFSSAVYSDHYELRHMLTQGVILGVGLSILTLIVGFSLPLNWILIYEALASLSLLILPTTVLPITLLVVTTLLAGVLGSSWLPVFDLQTLGLSTADVPATNFAWLFVIAFLGLGHWVAHYGGRFDSPRIYAKQRGKRIAGYPWRELLVVPVVTLVPGDWFVQGGLSWWPMLNLHGQTFAVLFLPLLLGVRFTVFREVPKAVYRHLSRQILVLAGLAVVLLGWLLWRPQDLPIGVIVLLVCYGWCLWQAKRYDHRQSFWYSQVDDGVRVLAIRPGTPANKLDLAAGDIILECNHRAVNSETAFYEALLQNPTYCHLRVRNMAGDLKVTETTIYSGAPHEIGIVLFRDQEG